MPKKRKSRNNRDPRFFTKSEIWEKSGQNSKKIHGQSIKRQTKRVSTKAIKRSTHIINLKNPQAFSAEDSFIINKPTSAGQAKSQPAVLAKPIRPTGKKRKKKKKAGINFLSGKNLLTFKIKRSRPINKKQPVKQPVHQIGEEIEDIFAPQENKISFSFFHIPTDWYKKTAIFALIAIVLILPLQAFTYYQKLQSTKDQILLITNEAIENLKLGEQAVTEFDLDGANLQFNQAKVNFNLAQKEISALNVLTTEILKLLPGQNASVTAGVALLEAGEIIAETGQILIEGGQNLLEKKDLVDYYHSLVDFENKLKLAINKFQQAKIKIEAIKPSDLPEQHQETFAKVLDYLPKIEQGLTDLYTLNHIVLKILGHEQWQRYMLVFLNNNELRGGGGFMGSFGLIDIDRGEIKKLEIPGGGTYAIQGQLVPKVISPGPLHLINSRWEFQDANWWPDFPTTARKMQWFYQNADGPSVDGVVAITSTLMERLLEIFGPITMTDYGREEINSENFVIETQKIVELEYDKEENKPKQFIADLAPQLLEKIFSADNNKLKELLEVIKAGLNEKHLLVYFNDQQLENIISDFGWQGELKETSGDYLSVVHSNIAGGKTDGVIKETIQHQANVQKDGSIINTVTLIRRHHGIPGENIFTGVQNNSYVRFYVPLGSSLLEANGFKKPPAKLFEEPLPEYKVDSDLISIESEHIEDQTTGMDIYKESGKTVFGNWLQLKPGEIQEITIKYRLPFKLALEGQNTFYYSLLAQKQAGSLGSELKSYLKLNNQLKPMVTFPAEITSDDQGVSFNSTLNIDRFYGAVLVNE